MNGSAGATAVRAAKEQNENSWLEACKYIWGIPLMLLLLVIVVALSPILLWLYLYDFAWGRETTMADTKGADDCHDYARGCAQGVEDMSSYRRRAEEAERELQRLRDM